MLANTTISVDRLFINTNAGRFNTQRFDAENLYQLCHQKQIVANIAPNKRAANDNNGSRFIDEKL